MAIQKFHRHARQFAEKAISLRKRLIFDGKSKMNDSLAFNRITHLERLLNTYGYRDDRLMATFWRRKKNMLMEILPGQNSRAHNAMIAEFNQLDYEANIILS